MNQPNRFNLHLIPKVYSPASGYACESSALSIACGSNAYAEPRFLVDLRPQSFGYTVPQYYLTAYIESEAGASPVVGATINALINVGSIAGRIGMGFVADTRV